MTTVISHIAGAPRRVRPRRFAAEDGVQISIVQYLRTVLPRGDYIVFHIPNQGKRSERAGAQLRRMWMVAGIPDLQILGPGGSSYFVEVKTDDGVLSKDQRGFQHFCIVKGVPCVIARGIGDVKAALQQWRIKTCEAA